MGKAAVKTLKEREYYPCGSKGVEASKMYLDVPWSSYREIISIIKDRKLSYNFDLEEPIKKKFHQNLKNLKK